MPLNPDSHAPTELEILSRLVNRGLLLLDTRFEVEFANAAACGLLACIDEQELKQRWKTITPGLQIEKNLPQALQPRFFKIDLPLAAETRRLRAEIHVRDEKFGNGYLLLLKDRQKMDALDIKLLLASQMYVQSYLQGAMAHDLRAPLNAMHITLELLGETLTERFGDEDKSSQQRCILVMKEELGRMNQMLQAVFAHRTLLDDAREEFDLRNMIEEIAALLQTTARRYRLDLQCQLPASEIKLSGQREALKQALLNIVINSMQAMPDGGSLEIKTERENTTANIVLTDQAPTLAADLRAQMYAVSFAAEADLKSLGLYVARVLVEMHNGDIEITSSKNQGNFFRVSLPLARHAAGVRTTGIRQDIFSS